MVALFDALPHDDCDRDAEGVSFSAGLYSRVKVGLRKACKLFPWTVQAVNRFAASLLGHAVYTSFAIFAEVQTREHRDTQNSFLPNYVIPLTKFEGGEITVHESEPPLRLDVSRGPVQFWTLQALDGTLSRAPGGPRALCPTGCYQGHCRGQGLSSPVRFPFAIR